MPLPKKVLISEVSPRDGWQNHPLIIPTETKIKYIKKWLIVVQKRWRLLLL